MQNISSCPVCDGQNLAGKPVRLRDSDKIAVLECNNCAHVFLNSFDHVNEEYFVNDTFLLSKPFVQGVEQRLRHFEAENVERYNRIAPLIVNKNVLEFGCGAGALMEKIRSLTAHIDGVERTESFRKRLTNLGFSVFERMQDANRQYDVILMFHVIEHLTHPIDTLREALAKLAPGGLLYIEVPNVNDILLSLYNIEAYQRFHFFKDHLHYFSRQSLGMAFERAGARNTIISGHNRFGLANHLYWLRHGKPGGHLVWNFLESPSLVREYARACSAMDASDSLIAQVRAA